MKKLNKLGFGTAPLSGKALLGKKYIGMGIQNKTDSKKSLEYAYDNGINFFDTADLYGNGRVEKLIGDTFGNIKNIFICSKYGNRIKNNKVVFDTSPEYFSNSLNSSLKRLKRENIYCYLLHSPPSNVLISDRLISFIERAINDGKITLFGISCRSINDAKKFIKEYPFIQSIQLNYNILDARANNFIKKINTTKKLFTISRAPYANGMIFERNLKKKFNKYDFRKNFDNEFKIWIEKRLLKIKNKIKNNDISEFALSFCLLNDNFDVVIPGMRSVDQIKNNIKISQKKYLNHLLNDSYLNKILKDTYKHWN